MRKYLLQILFALYPLACIGQISIDSCLVKAEENYPQIHQYRLIEQARNYTVSILSKSFLPQVSFQGKASFQSDVVTFPFSVPGVDMPVLPKDQYQAVIDLQQKVWDGGETHFQKQQASAIARESTEKTRSELYAVRKQVIELYFAVLLLKEQLQQNRLLQDNLSITQSNVKAYVSNGIANQSDVDAVDVELLNARQQALSMEATQDSYLQMLSLLLGTSIHVSDLFRPEVGKDKTLEIQRPELLYYQAQENRIDVALQALKSRYMPKLSLFLQGAYAKPGLNILSDKFDPYYVIGARLNWNFGSLYTLKEERQKLEMERKQIRTNRETFLLNTRLQLSRQQGSLSALEKQLQTDDEIVRLRKNIRIAAEAKVANGTMSVTDMLLEINRENQACQIRIIHEIQHLSEIYQGKYITNHFE